MTVGGFDSETSSVIGVRSEYLRGPLNELFRLGHRFFFFIHSPSASSQSLQKVQIQICHPFAMSINPILRVVLEFGSK